MGKMTKKMYNKIALTLRYVTLNHHNIYILADYHYYHYLNLKHIKIESVEINTRKQQNYNTVG